MATEEASRGPAMSSSSLTTSMVSSSPKGSRRFAIAQNIDVSVAQFADTPTKLEVMQGREMSRLLRSSTTIAFTAVGLTIIGVLITRFRASSATTDTQIVPTYLIAFDAALSGGLVLLGLAIAVHYGRRIFRLIPTNRSPYQLATFILLLTLLPTLLPTRAVAEMTTGPASTANRSVLKVDSFLQTIALSGIMTYTWITTRLSRAEHDQHENSGAHAKTTISGNVLVTIVVSIFMVARIVCANLFQIAFAPIPVQSFISFLNIISSPEENVVPASHVVPICFLTVYEVCILVFMYRSTKGTDKFLRSCDIVAYRNESIMHRFFKMSEGLLFIPLAMIAMIQFGYPTTQSVVELNRDGIVVLSPAVGSGAIALLYSFFASRQAYVNLPSDTDGVMDWMRERADMSGPGAQAPGKKGQNTTTGVASVHVGAKAPTALIYRAIDARDPDRGHPLIDAMVFSMETAVSLFNLSWLVYTYGTVGFSPAKPSHFGRPEYKVTKHIKDSQHDVHVLTISGPDRIVISFKGSNSAANAFTDKDTKLAAAVNAFRGTETAVANALPGISLHADSKAWRGCKVHHGYGTAYAGVRVPLLMEIRKLYSKRARPIFVTGHSSGGSLATLCSLELATQDGMSGPDQVSVYTFGSPRTGNSKFASLYDSLVKSNWRCVVAGDATVSTPASMGYQHVGKTAMFTRSGALTLETVVHMRWWQSQTSSHPMYKLTSYFCALRAWSMTHSGQDAKTTGLWDWPIDKTTSALFTSRPPPAGTKTMQKSDIENPPLTPAATGIEEALDDVVAFSK